jgi:hypothetical protein
MEKSMDRLRGPPYWLSQTEDLLDEACDFPIKKVIANLNANFTVNPISDQRNS